MFTGIVEEIGTVRNIVRGRKSIQITLSCQKVNEDVKIGDSISINGVCITVIEFGHGFMTGDVMPETMEKTNLGQLFNSCKVNMERALKMTDRLGGHLVNGHVDGVGKITNIKKDDNATVISFSCASEVLKYIVSKGSVCIDGTSLTVVDVTSGEFTVALIPHTHKMTNLGNKKTGDFVNIECDILGKYIERFFLLKNENQEKENPEKKEGISLEFLTKHGF